MQNINTPHYDKFYSAKYAINAEIPEKVEFIESLLPVGLSILSGLPKSGKSILALQMAVAISQGTEILGFKSNKCEVVYFDLESCLIRTKQRLLKMNVPKDTNIYFTNSNDFKINTPMSEYDIVSEIIRFIKTFSDRKVFIIDTLGRSKAVMKTGGLNAYDVDTLIIGRLQEFAIKNNIAILLVHHLKKGADFSKDDLEKASGTMGITGNCDNVLTLSLNGRLEHEATLSINGRDSEPIELKIKLNTENLSWESIDNSIRKNSIIESNKLYQYVLKIIPNLESQDCKPIFYSYKEIGNELLESVPEECYPLQIKENINLIKNELFIKYNTAFILGARDKTGSTRGIKIVKVA